jgi:beta-mannosidase
VAKITLNDRVVAAAANMHHPHRLDVRDALRVGANELVITFRSPLGYVHEQEARCGPRPFNGDWGPYSFIRKMACNFGWDWGPQVPTVGIWRDIHLHAWSGARLRGVRPLVLRADDEFADVAINTDLEWAAEPEDGLEIRAQLASPDRRSFETAGVASFSDDSHQLRIAVDRPALWWPRGHGEQPLYRLNVELTRADVLLDRREQQIGLRTVRLNTEPDEIGSRFALEINGRGVFARGANWIPDGLFPSEIGPDRYRARIRQARDANMNMLRVWGGGIYEHDAFYQACDQLGVMVWQDFMFTCATYPEEEPYRSLVEAEARHNITRLSSHPSVVLWCGGNECIWAYESWGFKEQLRDNRTWGRGFYFDLLPRLVAELDPTRPYWPNSPYSGSMRIHPQNPDHGNRHTWDDRIEDYRRLVPRFVSEFGHQSPPNYATLRQALPNEKLSPDCQALRHRQRAAGGNERQYKEPLEEWFRPPESFDEWHYLVQLLQARAISLGIEWLRAHSPRCMGVLYWQLNDCWAGHSWSAIDWAGRRKPLWYATRRAYAPRLLTIQPIDDRATLLAASDTDTAWTGTVRLRRQRFDGEILASAELPISIAPRACANLADLTDALGDPVDRRCELLVAAAGELRATWFFERDKHLTYPPPRFAARLSREPGVSRLHVEAQTLLRDVVLGVDRLDPAAQVRDHLVTLLPGESYVFEIESASKLTLEALTAPPVFNCANQHKTDL